jgi:nucleoside-diphosphate-sugar epimerase
LKILITGAKGFIGSNLCLKLETLNIPFIPYSEHHDTWDVNIFDQYLSDEITHVIHLAAKSFVPESWEVPEVYVQTNVNSTHCLLEFSRKINAKFIFLSSYMYGKPHYLPIDENHPTSVLNPYALSKYLSEEVCKFYALNFQVSTCVLRVFNIYGPGQKPTFLIPHVISQILKSEEINVLDLSPKRDYLYITDLVDAIISLFTIDSQFEIFNVGSGVSYSVREVIDISQNIAMTNKKVVSKSEKRTNEINDVFASTAKLSSLNGWVPKMSLKDGLKNCLDSN